MKVYQMPIKMQCEIFSTDFFFTEILSQSFETIIYQDRIGNRTSFHISYHMPYQQREIEMLISGSRTLCRAKIRTILSPMKGRAFAISQLKLPG